MWASTSLNGYVSRRFRGEDVQVKELQSLSQRIVDGKLHLTVREFLELALQNFADVKIAGLEVMTAADQITGAKSVFDPNVLLDFSALRSVSPLGFGFGEVFNSTGSGGQGSTSGSGLNQVTLPETINSLTQNSSVAYTQLLPTGEQFQATFGATRSSGNSYPFPALFGTLNFSLMQPLLQNRTNIQNRAPLTIARTEVLIVSEQTEAAIGRTITTAALQYWDAVLARDTVGVQQQAVGLAQKSYEHDKQALDLGALAKLDIYQSETQVAERTRDLVQAQYQYRNALDGLRRMIGADLTPALRATEIVLDDDPRAIPSTRVLPFEEALANALRSRPEIKASGQSVSIDNLNARRYRDELLPRLDLTLQGGATGPGLNQIGVGGVVGVTPTTGYPGLGETLHQVLAFNFPSYGFDLALRFPVHNSLAQASLADSLVNRVRDRYTQRQTQEQITLDVRQAITGTELANATIENATRARDLAQKNVEAEQQKYVLGSITAFELLDSQSRLASTESALLAAYVSYQEAYINYQRATWTLLDGLGFVLEQSKVH